MRAFSSWSTLPLALLIAALTGCPGADEATQETNPAKAGAAGAAGAGGTSASAGSGQSAAGNDAVGTGNDPSKGAGAGGETEFGEGGSGGGGLPPGSAGSAGSGPASGGSTNTDGDPEADTDGCVGKFQEGAPWPAAGRCSARQGNAPAAGPTKFGGLATATLESAIAASPVIDAAGNVYVVNAQGLTKLDKLLVKQTKLYTKGPISAAPVITFDNRVIALTEAGDLISVPVDGTEAKPLTYTKEDGEPKSGWTSSLALDAAGRVIFASPIGRVYIVDPTNQTTDPVSLGKDVVVAGSSISISTQGDFAIGTNKGLFVLPHGQTTSKVIPIPGAAVSRTPVFVPKSGKTLITAIYADDDGVVHNVSIDAAGDALDQPSKGAPPLGLSPGAPAVLAVTGKVAKVFIGDGSLLRLLDTSDGPAVVDSKTIALSAAGPIVGAAATDLSGQLFVPSTDGNIYRLTTPASDLNAFVIGDSFLTQGAIATAPALAENRLYFGSSDKKLYMITEEPVPEGGK